MVVQFREERRQGASFTSQRTQEQCAPSFSIRLQRVQKTGRQERQDCIEERSLRTQKRKRLVKEWNTLKGNR